MKELQDVINKKVKAMVEDGTISGLIETNIEKAITKALETEFQSYGSVTKQIEEAIKGGLKINPDDLPFESYSKQMMVALKVRLGNMFQGKAADKFYAEVEKLLAPAPDEISIEEFVEKIVEFWRSNDPYHDDSVDDYATITCEKGDYGYSLKLWKQLKDGYSSSRDRQADLNLHVSKGVIRINHQQEYNPTCFHKHEAFVFHLYAAGTKITGIEDFNPDDCELALKDYDH